MSKEKKSLVEQMKQFSFNSYSLCYYYFYFGTGYWRLFYKKIGDCLPNGHYGKTVPAA